MDFVFYLVVLEIFLVFVDYFIGFGEVYILYLDVIYVEIMFRKLFDVIIIFRVELLFRWVVRV